MDEKPVINPDMSFVLAEEHEHDELMAQVRRGSLRPTPVDPCRPWWRRKRWWAVGLLWLALLYPASAGPTLYVAYRGWLPWLTPDSHGLVYRWIGLSLIRNPLTRPFASPWYRYLSWFVWFPEDQRIEDDE